MILNLSVLSEEHSSMIEKFSCVESKDSLKELGYNSDDRRRIIKHSQDMDKFLKEEALIEQERNLNVTYLFIDSDEQKIVGYVSLCNDCIKLDVEEKEESDFPYLSIPALKIARLAVDNNYKGNKIGSLLIEFSFSIANKIMPLSGLVFVTLDCYKHRVSYYENQGFVINIYQPSQSHDSPISMRMSVQDYLDKSEENTNE